MVATTRALGETSGRIRRVKPKAPRGMQPRTSTFCSRFMAPNTTVPATPIRPKAGVDGAVVPTPAGCHPEKK